MLLLKNFSHSVPVIFYIYTLILTSTNHHIKIDITMKKITKVFILAGILFAAGCGSSTKLVGSWTDKENKSIHFEKIGVAALTPNTSGRYLIERAIAGNFKTNNINAVATYDTWPLAGRIGENPEVFKDSEALKNKVKAKVAEQEMDGLMIISLIDKETSERYVNTNNYYGAAGYYGGAPMGTVGYYGHPYGAYYNYYAYAAGSIYDTGYYVEDVTYYLEAKLFDTKNDKLLWFARTKTTNLEDVEKEAAVFADLIVKDIMAKKVIVP